MSKSQGNLNIIDRDGEWFVHRGLFRFVDPTNGNFFEPGLPTKVIKTDWMASQELIVPCPDPLTSDEPVPSVISLDGDVKPRLSDEDAAAAAAAAAASKSKKR
jgi:hypothetical protein